MRFKGHGFVFRTADHATRNGLKYKLLNIKLNYPSNYIVYITSPFTFRVQVSAKDFAIRNAPTSIPEISCATSVSPPSRYHKSPRCKR